MIDNPFDLLSHAVRECRLAGLFSGNDVAEEKLAHDVIELVSVFSTQNHHAQSTVMTLNLLDHLINMYPLAPLTGISDEWILVQNDPKVWQNRRFFKVYKGEDGIARDSAAVPVYIRPDGSAFTSETDEPPVIEFPYTPQLPPMIRVDEDGMIIG